MTIRFLGLVPTLALLAVGAAQAQSPNNATTGGGGQMAYPDSLPSGRVTVPAAGARDTGNMAYPASPGGVAQPAPMARDTGNMAYPDGTGTVTTRPMTRAQMRAARGTPAAAGPAASADSMAAAHALDMSPGAAPVPYTAFDAPGIPARVHRPMRARKPMARHFAVKKVTAPAVTATPAAPMAPAAPMVKPAAPAATTPPTK